MLKLSTKEIVTTYFSKIGQVVDVGDSELRPHIKIGPNITSYCYVVHLDRSQWLSIPGDGQARRKRDDSVNYENR